MTMNGSSADVSARSSGTGPGRSSDQATSRARFAYGRPTRSTTTTFSTLGDDADAAGFVAERRRDVVHPPAGPPGGPRDPATGIQHLRIGDAPDEPEIALGRAPEAVGIFDRPAQQRRVVVTAVSLGKRAQ